MNNHRPAHQSVSLTATTTFGLKHGAQLGNNIVCVMCSEAKGRTFMNVTKNLDIFSQGINTVYLSIK